MHFTYNSAIYMWCCTTHIVLCQLLSSVCFLLFPQLPSSFIVFVCVCLLMREHHYYYACVHSSSFPCMLKDSHILIINDRVQRFGNDTDCMFVARCRYE